MPYTEWTEVDRNLWKDPLATTDIVQDTTPGGGGPVTGFSDPEVTTAYRWIGGGSGAARMFDFVMGTDTPAAGGWWLSFDVDSSATITVELALRPSIGSGTNGFAYNFPIAAGRSRIDLLIPTGWNITPGASSGLTLIKRDTWSAGTTIHITKVKIGTTPDWFNPEAPDTDVLRYSWLGATNASVSVAESRSFISVTGSKTLRPNDLLVEFRDRNLKRQGSIPVEDLRLKVQPVFNGFGSWQLQLPAEHRAVPYLRAPGSGIVVTNLVTGETLVSGITSRPSKRQTKADPNGMVTVSGLTDDVLLWHARAFPDPAVADPAAQTAANDLRTDVGSTLMRAYVDANIGPGSPVARRGSSLRNRIILGADPILGATTTRRPRYDVLGDLLMGIATETGLGFRLVQVGDSLEFQVYQPQDRSKTIRLDVRNGTLNETSVETAPAEVTRMIVAGQGEGVDRNIQLFTTTDATQSEEDWGLIIEEWQDQRQTNEDTELESSAMERLNEAGFTKVAVKATPAQDQTMIFLTDFFLGDKVAVVVDGQEQSNSTITEAAIIIDDQGMETAIAIGDIADFDSESALRQTVQDTVRRVEHLERNAEQATPVEPEPDPDPIPYRMASGSAAMAASIANGAGVTVDITFPPGRFTQPPIVFAIPTNSARIQCAVLSGVTVDGCQVRVDNWSGANATLIGPLNWQAIQMLPGAAAG